MLNILRKLSRNRFPYEPLIVIKLSGRRLIHNLDEFRKLAPGKAIAPVLKSNAYGHGLFEIADVLASDRAIPFFAVDSYFEAVALRAHGVMTPLLIIGFSRGETMKTSTLKQTSFTLISLDSLRELADTTKDVTIHLKIDTGMHRQGMLLREIPEAIHIVKNNSHIILEGILTHFSEADSPDPAFTRSQIASWNEAVKQFTSAFRQIRYIHAGATDGSRFVNEIEANVIRLGIGLYGLSENKVLNEKLDLLPILSMETIVSGVKKIFTGETVGYGNTFVATRDMTIATIPVGYYEGLDRRLSNNGVIQVGPTDTPCPIIGRVSMNITTIDVSGVPDVRVGTPVVVIDNNESDQNSIRAIAERCGTVSYEIAVKIPAHLKRVVID